MINPKNYIGQDRHGSYIFQEIGDKSLIRGFNGYQLVETVQGERGLENVQWSHSETVNGVTYKKDDQPAPVVPMPDEIIGLYEMNTMTCSECGACHDSEGDVYGRTTYVILNECDPYCKECVKPENLLTKLAKPADLFQAKDLNGVDLEGYEEVDTLFCDSSGFGGPGERALTKTQALTRATELINGYPESLYVGITDIGQFQLYVTVYRKVA